MYTHIFTTVDAAQQVDEKLHSLTFFDPQYDPQCKAEDGSTKMNTDKIQTSFNTDINRSPNLYIETLQGLTNITQDIWQEYGDDYVICYSDVYNVLTNKYKLSKEQAGYILAASYQGSIAGGLTGFGALIAGYITDPMQYMNRNGNMSKIVIDHNNNLSYIGGQKMTFDCDRTTYSDIIKDTVHVNFQSKDYVSATISAQLGQLGASQVQPQVIISTIGEGAVGSKIINELKKIESNSHNLPTKEKLLNYNSFVNSIIEVNGQNTLYQQAIRDAVSKVLYSDSSEINPDTINNLRKLNFVPETLGKILFHQIETQLNMLSDENSIYTAKNIITCDLTKSLVKFIDSPKGYVERFASDLAQQCMEAKKLNMPKKNIIQTIVSYLKDIWHGYDKAHIKNTLLDNLKSQAQAEGLKIKCLTQVKHSTKRQDKAMLQYSR